VDGRWFKTGDIAEVSPDGYYKILGRSSSDIIKVTQQAFHALVEYQFYDIDCVC
jgi:acyl-CoA synthetase (AMP-forming)/AMP-acid ligase II